MNFKTTRVTSILLFFSIFALAQSTNPVLDLFPQGTILHSNIAYVHDTLQKHKLDIYLPANAKANLPLIIWVHGGAWMMNDKYADMNYMKNTIQALLKSGFAIASIDYRQSTQAIFPAQIQDCNLAVEYLYQNANTYHLDRNKFGIIGFSAGGHLASLLALSQNNGITTFITPNAKKSFKIKAVVDFYGPSELISQAMAKGGIDNSKSPEAVLLGASPIARPDLAKIANPVTYVDKNDPPFLIIHGEKDESVPPNESILLSSWLTLSGVSNEVIIVKDAPHYGVLFDAEPIRLKVITFLTKTLQ
ncbi:alpha/beta hydrolase [Flavobacterium restrictum]|uniref:Alpha/beta hydrolase n=1 Tax=Flavobacterium restrictum TaxID=2594428 RepID=A0A553E8Z1_9FLAO|nr:alpha/beta hydrolase [Flavobacterium restrictum]TRX41455.1 alpha/beta hydrolase [Flavobacterium restrictum]